MSGLKKTAAVLSGKKKRHTLKAQVLVDKATRRILCVRAELMQQIAKVLEENGWTQQEAASRCVVAQPRINDLGILEQ